MYYDEKHCKDKEMFKVISKHNFYAGFLITDFGFKNNTFAKGQ